jgi:hypothetical protein
LHHRTDRKCTRESVKYLMNDDLEQIDPTHLFGEISSSRPAFLFWQVFTVLELLFNLLTSTDEGDPINSGHDLAKELRFRNAI